MDTEKQPTPTDYPDTHDHILDAYFGKMGDGFMRDTQKRVHWVCGQAQGRRVLDVGCSQGIVPFLLAREGYQVTGIDSDVEAIVAAQAFFAKQSKCVQKNVTLINDDFASYSFADDRFDSVIISEVLEHLVNPASFVALAAQLLNNGGRLIVTVPFGINDYIDHKRTYYALEPLRLLWELFAVDAVELFGKWIGFSCSKRAEPLDSGLTGWPWALFAEVEKSFQNIERGLLDQLHTQRTCLDKANEKYRTVTEQVAQLKKQLNEKSPQENSLVAKDEQFRAVEETLQHLRHEMAENRARMDETVQAGRELTEQLLQLHDQKRQVEDALAAASRDVEVERSQRLSAESVLAAVREEIVTRQAQSDAAVLALQQSVNSQKIEIEIAATTIDSLRGLLVQSQAELDVARQEVQREQSQRIVAEKEILRLQEQSKYQKFHAEETLRAREEQIATGKDALQRWRQETESNRALQQLENDRLLGDVAELQRQCRELQIELATSAAVLQDAGSKVQSPDSLQDEEVAELKRQLSQRDEELATARQEELDLREALAHAQDEQQKVRTAFIEKSSALELSQALRRDEEYHRQQNSASPAPGAGPSADFASLLKHTKVACIMDEFTFGSYKSECNLLALTPQYWQQELDQFRPELLIIESAWRGKDDLWWNTVPRNCEELLGVVDWCHEHKVPTVFWCKEDPVHFETFLNTAKLFDTVFTTDIDCIHRYKGALGHDRVYLLPFACQPQTTNPLAIYERKDAFCFAGAYYLRYPDRTRDLGNFVSTLASYRPVEIFDRNYGKTDPNYQFPAEYQPYIVGNLPFDQIDKAYKGYRYAINLNSIKQSQSMFARRVFDLLASNTLTVSNFSRGVRLLFGDLIITTDNGDEIVRRLQTIGKDESSLRKFTLAGLRKVMQEHTYQDRLAYILSKAQGISIPSLLPPIIVTAYAQNQTEFDLLLASFARQSYASRRLLLCVPASFSPGNVPDDEKIQVLNVGKIEGVRVREVLSSSECVAAMVPDDYYGPNYLLDLALATRYSNSAVIGKAAHYLWSATAGLSLAGDGEQYRPVRSIAVRASLVKASVVQEFRLRDWLTSLDSRQFEAGELLGIDEFNYCANGHTEEFLTQHVATVNDLAGLNPGIGMDEFISRSERISPAEVAADTSPVLSGAKFASYFEPPPASKDYRSSVSEQAWDIDARLAEGVIEYLYATSDFRPAELGYTDRVRFYLDATPGLDLQMVMLFFDENEKRTGHIIRSVNRNHEAEIPAGTVSIRLGLRLFGKGSSRISALVLGHRLLQPAEVLGQANHLVLTDHYPAYNDLYRNGFVHSRVAAYRRQGIRTDVFRLRSDEPLSYSEFQDFDIITGSQEALHKLLTGGEYQSVLVHFLNERMWQVLQNHIDQIPVFVWVHGAEIQPWHRRDFINETEAQRDTAKIASRVRMDFWTKILNPMNDNLNLVFVSQYLADAVAEDLGLSLPENKYKIIHNAIDTELFSYIQKSPQQRKKILSIRPYASRTYANDLSVQAILALQNQSWFNELEFRMIGDGILFEKTLEPVRSFKNVVIEQRFLSRDEIALLHKEYGILLCPSRMDTQGVSRDEAMSSGLVPITNKVAAIPEFVDETCGILADGDDAEGLAAGIIDLYENPDKFLAMSQAAAERVRRQSAAALIINKELALFHRAES